eukprot:TRINITY_DN6733_c0_g1_i2.p1 TRINITY_DN6733_c0_g1~~TRINITY_DN6733_c0_g1_i2.p1  ORF type:complete len:211 (+),score=61.45 TRINITY_DN6733_c0_g1_i2:95-727(+)
MLIGISLLTYGYLQYSDYLRYSELHTFIDSAYQIKDKADLEKLQGKYVQFVGNVKPADEDNIITSEISYFNGEQVKAVILQNTKKLRIEKQLASTDYKTILSQSYDDTYKKQSRSMREFYLENKNGVVVYPVDILHRIPDINYLDMVVDVNMMGRYREEDTVVYNSVETVELFLPVGKEISVYGVLDGNNIKRTTDSPFIAAESSRLVFY